MLGRLPVDVPDEALVHAEPAQLAQLGREAANRGQRDAQRLVLLLANHIGDICVLREAMKIAREGV